NHDARGDDVHAQADGNFLPQPVGDAGGEGEDQPAVERQPAAADVDRVPEVRPEATARIGVRRPVLQHVRKTRADDAGNQGDQSGVDEQLRVEPRAAGEVLGQLQRQQKADDQHDAVAVDGDVYDRDAEQLRVHDR